LEFFYIGIFCVVLVTCINDRDSYRFSPPVAIYGGYGMCELIVSVLQFLSAAEPVVCRFALLNLVVTGSGKIGLAGKKRRGVGSSIGFERGCYRHPLCERRFGTRSLFTDGVSSLFTRQKCNRSSDTGFTGSLSNTKFAM
jgi:hypothetical protein